MPSHDLSRAYPVPGPSATDPRFCTGLVLEVAETLQRRGYPVLDSRDITGLEKALHQFLYGPEGETDA